MLGTFITTTRIPCLLINSLYLIRVCHLDAATVLRRFASITHYTDCTTPLADPRLQ